MYHRIITSFSLFITILASLTACTMHTRVVDVKLDSFVDTAVYAILPYDPETMADMNWRYKNVHPGVLTTDGVDSLETIIESACKAYNEKTTDSSYQVMPLNKYRRQYVPVVTANGERVVWVNFFCDDFHSKWRKQVLVVNDGGNCFFQLYIDVNHREAYDLGTNGYAFLPGTLVPYCPDQVCKCSQSIFLQ